MQIFIGIYAIHKTNSNHVYIGHSRDIKKRWSNHKAQMAKGKHYHAELNEGWQQETIRFEILVECSVDELQEQEAYWMKHMSDIGFNVLNNQKAGKAYCNSELGKQHKREAQRGSRNGNSRLNEQQVREIRQKFEGHEATLKALAQEYGVSTSHAWNICNNLRWIGAVL